MKHIYIKKWKSTSEVEGFRKLIKRGDLEIDSYSWMNDLLSVDLSEFNFRKFTLSINDNNWEIILCFID